MDRFECRICGNSANNSTITLREAMFETWEEFDYYKCGECGCLQIARLPTDIQRHYRSDYYSLSTLGPITVRRWLKARALRYASGNGSMVGWILWLAGLTPEDSTWLAVCRPGLDGRILDVGCGSGARIRDLALAGFRHVVGVDPYVPADSHVAPGVEIRKSDLRNVAGEFDLVMFHHSFEHTMNPVDVLTAAARLLSPVGMVLIRIPVFGKWAWRNYGTDWVQLDAPRHLFSFTENAMRHLAARASLTVSNVIYDSTSFQFVGSEDIKARRSLLTGDATRQKRRTRTVLHRLSKCAKKLNKVNDGDQACFFLAKA